jgi:hypothetical protein
VKRKSLSEEKEELKSAAQHFMTYGYFDLAQRKLIQLAAQPRTRATLAFYFLDCLAAHVQPKHAPKIFHLFDEFMPLPLRQEVLENALVVMANMCVRVRWDFGYFRCFVRTRQFRRAGLVSPRFTIMPTSYAHLRKHGYYTSGARI